MSYEKKIRINMQTRRRKSKSHQTPAYSRGVFCPELHTKIKHKLAICIGDKNNKSFKTAGGFTPKIASSEFCTQSACRFMTVILDEYISSSVDGQTGQ